MATHLRLHHGEFFGRPRHRVDVMGFAVADMQADPAVHVRRHTHDVAHLILLLSGRYVTSAPGAPSICARPTVIYNPPGTTHQDRFVALSGRAIGRFLSVSVAASRMEGIADQVTLAQQPICLADPDALAVAIRLSREIERRNAASPLAVEGLCIELVAHAARGRIPIGRSAPSWLRIAEELLREASTVDVGIEAVARSCGVHPVHLARTFRRFHGCAPADYRRRCRIDRVAQILRSTNRRLCDVAVECGFCDQSQLSKAFRHAYAMAPGEYRRALRQPDVSS